MRKKKMLSAGRAGVGLTAQLLLVILALYISPALADRQITPLQDEDEGGLASSSEGQLSGLLSEDGIPYPDAQAASRPVIDPSWTEELANMNPSEMVRVIIFLENQPQRTISREVRQRHETELESIRQGIRAIKDKYAARSDQASATDAENYSREILAPGSEDRLALDALNERHEAASLNIKQDMAAALKTTVDSDQASVKAAITALGGEVESSTIAVNAIIARVPAGSISEIAAIPKVARISEDRRMDMHLNIADEATRISTTHPYGGLRDNGECGGIFDPAVLDTGIDLAHPALEDSAGRTNYYSWYLAAAVADSRWDDVIGIDDLHHHGTHVQGIVSSMGTSSYPDHLGMANCVDRTVTLKAGWNGTDGGHMFHSDGMALVDRALYDTDQLRPTYSFFDDVDGINLSFGGDATADESDYSRFFDSIISTYPDLIVTISAGNSGPVNTVFSDPANNYNAITVANVNDGGTADRDDDTIYDGFGNDHGSTRGPTLNGRRKPDIAAPGTNISSAHNEWETEVDFYSRTGTSMAAPMIQGIAMDLMDAGVIDELEIKALLLNTAQKNEPGINFESDSDGWSEAYGWGYVNALAAYFHRADVRRDSVTPRGMGGDYVLYKGQMKDEGDDGEGRDRVTMVWNRHADYSAASYPSTYYGLSDLNLRLYDESNNNLIDFDINSIDNVHQVRVAADASESDKDVVVKAYAWSTSFAHGGTTEEFALATEEDFVKAAPPSFTHTFSAPAFVGPYQTFNVTVTIHNNGDVAAHNNLLRVKSIVGVSGPWLDNNVTLPSIPAGGSQSYDYELTTNALTAGSYFMQLVSESNSYNEDYSYSTANGILLNVETTPPVSDCTSPEFENGVIAVDWTASDAGTGVQTSYLYVKAPGSSTFEYALQNAPGTSGTFNYEATQEGQYYFAITSSDFGNIWEGIPTTAECATFHDSVVPASTLATPATDLAGSIGLTYNVTDASPSSGMEFVDFWYRLPGGIWTYTGLFSLTSKSGTVYFMPPTDGIYEFTSRVKDKAQNIEPYFVAKSTTVYDTLPPTGSIVINAGAAVTNSLSVTLDLSATDAGSGVSQMRFSNDGVTWSPYVAYATAYGWNLSSYGGNTGHGMKTVYAQFVDGVGRVSATYTDTINYGLDSDGDGVIDSLDNCTLVENPAQRDTDSDGYGNYCDGDFDNNLAVNFADLGYMKSVFFTPDAEADLNGDGAVNFADLGLLKSMFFQPPGPSGLVP